MTTNEALLREFSKLPTPPTVTEVVPGTIYHVMGYGHSNASFVIASDSVVLIDTLDSQQRGAALRQLIREHTDKPISTIIYTHGHPDHRGGAGALVADNPEIIAFAPNRPPLARSELVQDVLNRRGRRQFGYDLADDDIITQGLGPREGHTHGDPYQMIPPTRVISASREEIEIGGIKFYLLAAPGETDDTIYVWLPHYRVVCSADNYYASWPNLYPIRGGQYRDIATWIDSLDHLISLEAEALLPGHFHPIIGAGAVRERLMIYRDALDFILTEALRLINQGVAFDDIGHRVRLPDHLRDQPFLREHYGTIEWSVKAIYMGYVGWFDGNPTHLHPLLPKDRAARLVAAMGGKEKVAELASEALADTDYQWAMELCDYLLAVEPESDAIRTRKAEAMLAAAHDEISACGRNYYTSCAREITSH
ncbi:MAG: alkyl/aryl-sulfatase [Thermomicrobiales bacterium]|nr:alkyl/aryl-sulfatase [Thermomicrobiales bacterium]